MKKSMFREQGMFREQEQLDVSKIHMWEPGELSQQITRVWQGRILPLGFIE